MYTFRTLENLHDPLDWLGVKLEPLPLDSSGFPFLESVAMFLFEILVGFMSYISLMR